MSPSIMNQIQRDAMRKRLPAFKTIGYEGKGDPDMRTRDLKPGTYLDDRLQGFTVPSFDDLVRGLRSIPTGPDARALTQCLLWYLQVRDTFQPRLELNVLHAQALIRALRQPLQPVGKRNLNRLALEQWQRESSSNKIDSKYVGSGVNKERREPNQTAKSAGERAVINSEENTVQAEIRIPLRNILTFPFLALHGVVSKAFQMGIDKAERRRAVRQDTATPTKHMTPTKRPTPAKSSTMVGTNNMASPETTLKRTREPDFSELLTPAQTPKRQRKLHNGIPGEWALRRPTVSPITPRAAPQPRAYTNPRDTLVNLEFGLRKRGPAWKKP